MSNFLSSLLKLNRKAHSDAIARPVHRPSHLAGDSHPVQFRGISIDEIIKGQDRWLSQYNPLQWLTIDVVRRCMQDSLRGAYAEQQWIWDQLEQFDTIMLTCVNKRDASLKKFTGDVIIKQGLSDRESLLAEAQKRTIGDLINAIVNIDEAIIALSQASRRHYKFLQPFEDSRGLHLLPIDNWLMCRDGYNGAWGYNSKATLGKTKGDDLQIKIEDLMCRVHPRPLNVPAQMLALSRKTTLAQWDVFLGKYGCPPTYFVMPPDLDEELRADYIKVAQMCVSGGAGVLSAGTDLKSPAVPPTSVELFDRRYKLANEEMVMLYTHSKLTMLAESGSGTLAGGAHQDGWDEWGDGEASEIAGVITAQLVNRCLDQYHPGQPYLVEYALNRVDKSDPGEEIANVSMLRSAGYDINDADVAERTGWDVKQGLSSSQLYSIKAAGFTPEQSSMEDMVKMPLNPIPIEGAGSRQTQLHSSRQTVSPYALNRVRDNARLTLALYRDSTTYAPARRVLEQLVIHRLASIDEQLFAITSKSLPLENAETEALHSILSLPDQDDLLALTDKITPLLVQASKMPDNANGITKTINGSQRTQTPVATPLQLPANNN